MKKHTILGFCITIFWIFLVAWLIYYNPQEINDLDLNEWGDFLAGAVAPLALIWFVIGYFLQSEELGLQRKELIFQAQQIERQAKAIEGQLDLEKRKHQPNLIYARHAEGISYGETPFNIYFTNKGGPAKHAEVGSSSTGITKCEILPKINIDTLDAYRIRFNCSSKAVLPTTIKLTYFDLDGNRYVLQGLLGKDKHQNVKFFDDPTITSASKLKTIVTKN